MTVYPPQTWIDGVAGQTPVNAARLTTMETGIQGASRAAMQALATPGPADYGYLGWSHDPAIITPAVTPVSGVLMLQRLPQWVGGQSVSGMSLALATSGTLTSGSNLLGLYDINGTLLGQTTDLTSLLTAPGEYGPALLTPATLDGTGACYAALLIVGTVMPTLVGSAPSIAGVGSGQLITQGIYRQASYGTGLTALPPALTMASLAPTIRAPWLAIW